MAAAHKKIKFLRSHRSDEDGANFAAGAVADLPEKIAERLIANGTAEEVEPETEEDQKHERG